MFATKCIIKPKMSKWVWYEVDGYFYQSMLRCLHVFSVLERFCEMVIRSSDLREKSKL